MKTRVSTILVACGLVFASACAKQEAVREIDWAKSALARNPAYEIVATDESAGVFTVRDTTTGTVQTLRLEDLIAGPKPAKGGGEVGTRCGARRRAGRNAVRAPQPAGLSQLPARAAGSETTAGPGTQSRSAARRPVTTLEGPGYTITRERTRGDVPSAEQLGANVERRTDPIICQGDRLMRIDGETIEFTGDAVIAEKGCDLYISKRTYAPAASASSRARRACTSSTAPSAARAVRTKRRKAPKSTWRVPRSPGSAAVSILRP